MRALLSLFARSPFVPLQTHMDKVAECVHRLTDLFNALQNKEFALVEEIAQDISKREHAADLAKNELRNNLPKSLFLPIDRGRLLEILSLQDSLADTAEDIAVLTTLKPLEMPEDFIEDFTAFLQKNLDSFDTVQLIIKEINDLLESSFGGVEAQKVNAMVEDVAFKEHEADVIQRKLLKRLFQAENTMTYPTFTLWLRIFESITSLSNLSEKLAYRVRMTLELK